MTDTQRILQAYQAGYLAHARVQAVGEVALALEVTERARIEELLEAARDANTSALRYVLELRTATEPVAVERLDRVLGIIDARLAELRGEYGEAKRAGDDAGMAQAQALGAEIKTLRAAIAQRSSET